MILDSSLPISATTSAGSSVVSTWMKSSSSWSSSATVPGMNEIEFMRSATSLRVCTSTRTATIELEPGDRVVVSPIQVVVEGMRVRPIDDRTVAASEARPS